MSNQRSQPRIAFEAEVELVLENGDKQKGRLTNISSGGTFVLTAPPPPFGTKVNLLVHLPGIPDRCAIPCIVRWTKGDDGAGLQFEHLRALEMWAINRLKRDEAEAE